MTIQSPILTPPKLLAANQDLIATIGRSGLTLIYDEVLDTLFLQIGETRNGSCEFFVDTIMVRIFRPTLEILGLEIAEFFSDFVPEHRLVATFVEELGIKRAKNLNCISPQVKPRHLANYSWQSWLSIANAERPTWL